MTFRRRMNRKADSGMPGYDNLGRLNMGHPAAKELPSIDQYGFDAEFGEGVRKGPYLSGPPPASYGWMPDHPAAKKSLVEDYEIGQELHDANIKKAMEKKANKCIAIAEHRLGRTASAREIESLALRLMDLPNSSINSKYAATDFMAEEDILGMDEMGMDEMGEDDELASLMAEIEADEEEQQASFMAGMHHKQASRRNKRASFRNRRRASMFGQNDNVMAEDDELASMLADLEAGDEMQQATGYHGSDFGPGNRNADFDGGIMGYDEFDGGMMMEDDFSDAMSPVDVLAEELATLKQANANLKRRLKKAEEAVQDATGYHGEEDSVQPAGRYKEPGEGAATAKYASKRGLKRLANVLADYLAEEEVTAGHGHMSSWMADQEEAEEENVMAEILAELEAGYNPNVSQNAGDFGYSENLIGEEEEADDEDVASMLASMLAEEQAKKQASKKAPAKAEKAPAKAEKASAKKESEDPMGLDEEADDEEAGVDPKLASLFAKFAEEEEADEEEADEEEEKKSSKKASAKGKKAEKGSKSSTKGKLAEEEEADEEEETASKKSSKGEKKSNKKAFEWKFSADEEADEEEADDEEADDEEADEEETTASKKKASWRFAEEEEADDEEAEDEEADEEETTASKKKASFSPRPSLNSRKAAVKTLGNISRTASKSDSNELSKLWESAPDVSKFFS